MFVILKYLGIFFINYKNDYCSVFLFHITRSLLGSHTSGPACSSITLFTFSKISSNESPFMTAKNV